MPVQKVLDRPIKITVCADGFVSLCAQPKHRRLKAALPVHSVNTYDEAVVLVAKVCNLAPCFHGGKTGLTLEPHAPHWPAGGSESLSDLDVLAVSFQLAEEGL